MGDSFKNYIVNYDLLVTATKTEGFVAMERNLANMRTTLSGIQKPLKDFASHSTKIAKAFGDMKKNEALKFVPTFDMKTFDAQGKMLVAKATQVAEQVSAIINGALTFKPTNTGGSDKRVKGNKKSVAAATKTVTEQVAFTTSQLQKEVNSAKKKLNDVFGKTASMKSSSKGYKKFLESIDGDVAKQSMLKQLRLPYEAALRDLAESKKKANKGKITKSVSRTITESVTSGIATSKNATTTTKAFDGILSGLVSGKTIEIPVSVVANAKTAESVNAALAKMSRQIKPITIPITVATNIDAAKAVRETVHGMQNVITPSSTGTKAVNSKGKSVPVTNTGEQKALEKELKGLKSEQNKYNWWKKKHDEWKQKVAEVKQGGATAKPSDAVLQRAMEKVLYTDKGKKRIVPVKMPKLMSLTPAETAELNSITLATDPLIQQKTELENRLAALKKSAAKKALTGKKLEEAKNIKQNLLPQVNRQLEAAGESRRAELLQKQAGFARQYEADKQAYKQWLSVKPEYDKQLEREQKALTRPSVQRKVNEAAMAMMPTTKLPTEPKLAEGVRTPKQIEARRAQINQRLAEIQGAGTVQTGGTKASKTSGKAGVTSIAPTQQTGLLRGLTAGRAINIDTRVVSTGQAGFDLNAHLMRLQEIAIMHPIKVDTRLVPTGQSAFELNAHIAKLQELAMARPVRLNTAMSQNATGTKNLKGGKSSTPANAVPLEGVVESVALSKGAKVVGGPVKIEGIVENVGLAKGAKVALPDVSKQVKGLRELVDVWRMLPKTGSRTFTVNLKTPGLENITRLRELVAMVEKLPPSLSRSYNVAGRNANRGNAVGNRGSQGMYIGGGRDNSTRYMGRPRGSMNTFAYQLMGNTSLGARTPVFVDMMKGMGMMYGVGAAMGTLTDSFTNASEYQNTMVTARSILEANYKGANFDKDFGDMEKIVRNVAKQTKFTAPQAADAARFMAMAGLDIPMINASIRPVADVAVIGDNDLGEVADKITNIQTAFGIKPNKMRALADALTKTFTSSNTDMMMLAESMEYAAPMAHLAGAQVEDALAMIGIMGNAGIQGSMAGTTLRMMYQNIINPNKKQKAMWEKLGVNLRDASGNPRQLMDILADLRGKVRLSKDDKNVDGTYKDEGTPVADAVSKLFRVTASAGAGTLLENLDSVVRLAQENRNASGLSERISLVKQNNVKGMYAKMTSAFTDAVVTEFENNDGGIKNYLENITKYLNGSDFRELLHDIFDMVTSMLDMLGTFANIWKSILHNFGGVIKYVLMAQFYFAQIGYLIAPLRSVWLTISRGIATLKGVSVVSGIGGATTTAAGAASMGGAGMVAASSAPYIKFGNKAANYNTAAINAARKSAMRADSALINSRKYLAAATAANAATTPAIEKAIAKKQMQWFVASNLIGSEASLRSHDNRPSHWNLAYTNPQAASELPSRAKIMNAREREIAALQTQLRRRNANIAGAEALVAVNAMNSADAHRELNKRIANVRHGSRRVTTDVLNRAVQMGKINRFGASGMAFSSGFRSAVSWGITGASLAGSMKMLTSVVGFVGKAFGALLNPITLVVGALSVLGYTFWKSNKKFNEQNERWQKQINESGSDINNKIKEALGGNDSISSIFENIKTINVNTASINVDNEQKAVSPIAKSEEYKAAYESLMGKLFISNNPQTKGFSSIAGISYDTWGAMYDQYVAPMRSIFGNMPDRESFMKIASGNGRMKDQASNAMLITKSIIGQKAILSDEYKNAEERIKEIRKQYANLPKDERIAKWSEYQSDINSVISQFNPLNKYGLANITRTNFQTALNATPSQFREYYEALYNSLQKYSNEAVGMEMINGVHSLDTGVKEYTGEWWNAIGKIVGSFDWSPDGNMEHRVFFPIQNGTVQLNKLSEELKANNYIVMDKVRTYVKNLSAIYDTIYSDPQLNGILNNLSKEDFLKHLLHQPSTFGFSFMQNDRIDDAINEYLGKTDTKIPLAPLNDTNQFNVNKWLTPKWGINQSGYKNNKTGGLIAQSAPPNIRFDGPLIRIDNIKGGDGVTPDELKDAVAKAVTDTLGLMIQRPIWQS